MDHGALLEGAGFKTIGEGIAQSPEFQVGAAGGKLPQADIQHQLRQAGVPRRSGVGVLLVLLGELVELDLLRRTTQRRTPIRHLLAE
jgi:hypothetical protein